MSSLQDRFALKLLTASPFRTVSTYTPASGAPRSITIDFSAEFVQVGDVGDVDAGLPAPAALCATVEVPAAARGDTLWVSGVTYYVQEARPQGDGFTVLILSRES